MDGKILALSESKIGINPNCRRITTPYFDDMDKYGERTAKDNEGKTFYVPADMTYKEWEGKLDNGGGDGIIKFGKQFGKNRQICARLRSRPIKIGR